MGSLTIRVARDTNFLYPALQRNSQSCMREGTLKRRRIGRCSPRGAPESLSLVAIGVLLAACGQEAGSDLGRAGSGAGPDAGGKLQSSGGAGSVASGGQSASGSVGSGGTQGTSTVQDPGALGAMRISEIMYHPVLEDGEVERHEFVELHNPSERDISLSGATLGGGIQFRFPEGSSIGSGSYLVVAKDKSAFDALYPEVARQSVGDYAGQLGNGGDTIRLIASNGAVADEVTYDDGFPWPAAADAFGVGRRWLSEDLLPEEQHRYRGYSLERISFSEDAKKTSTWSSSTAPTPTPGAPNSALRTEIPPLVVEVSARSATSGTSRIGAADPVLVEVRFDSTASVRDVAIEWYLDRLGQGDEPKVRTPMVASPAVLPGFSATLPAHPPNSLIRYRIVGEDGSGARVFAPREREPRKWYGFFVDPEIQSRTRIYHLFVEPQDWAHLWDNIIDGRELGCGPNPTWDDAVPATFVFEGAVIDVQVRYQGSLFNRTKGIVEGSDSEPWSRPLSVRVAFPRYQRFEDRDVVTLNKLNQGCPGLSSGLGYRLFEQVGLPTPEIRYARLQLNGEYYNYALEIERPGERMLERWHQKRSLSGFPLEPIGELYKAVGTNKDAGPWGPGNGSLLSENCGYSSAARYAFTYELKTNEWAGSASIQALIENMHRARSAGAAATRRFVEENFDIPTTLSYLAIRNWGAPFDDIFQNYFLYRSRTTEKWTLLPWDLDLQFEALEPTASLLLGDQQNPQRGNWSFFKDTLLGAFREEYLARVRELNSTLLRPESIASILKEYFQSADFSEAQQSPSGMACKPEDALSKMLAWTEARHKYVATPVD